MKVSVFTPSHNSDFLPEIYKSLKTQTCDNWEWCILYNNGGVPLNFKDSRVKQNVIYKAPEWVGALKGMTCEMATGDVLLELDHDDVLMPTAIEETVKAFERDEIGFAYSNTIHALGDFSPVERFDERYGWKYREVDYNGHKLDEHISFEPNPDSISKIWFAPNHLRAFRKELYYKVGGYNKGMRILDDLDLMCRFYETTKFYHIDKPLYIYRVHGKNTWLRYNKEIQDNVHRIHDKYIGDLASRFSDMNNLKKVELGGRFAAKKGLETVDLEDADTISDLNETWPFDDSSVGLVRAIDIFEHLRDPIFTMKELYRVLAPGGWALIQVPSTDGRGAFQDPTHKSFWNENSFFYYTKSNFAKYIDTPVRFQASRLYTTKEDKDKVCWTIAHLVSLKDGYRPAGLIEI